MSLGPLSPLKSLSLQATDMSPLAAVGTDWYSVPSMPLAGHTRAQPVDQLSPNLFYLPAYSGPRFQ